MQCICHKKPPHIVWFSQNCSLSRHKFNKRDAFKRNIFISTTHFMKPSLIMLLKWEMVQSISRIKRFLFYLIIYCNFISLTGRKNQVNQVSWWGRFECARGDLCKAHHQCQVQGAGQGLQWEQPQGGLRAVGGWEPWASSSRNSSCVPGCIHRSVASRSGEGGHRSHLIHALCQSPPAGLHPALGHQHSKDMDCSHSRGDQKPGAALLWTQGERAGAVQPGELKALRRPLGPFQCLKGLQKWGPERLSCPSPGTVQGWGGGAWSNLV